ncbi:hypothetical protein ACTJIJ_07665 [Niabella sp. 22666]|uniref:hypothetical protein n=1 Tax=Niabella sp. 22666 TaxID=3453954 RepID=UPI003F83C530
MEKDEFKEIWQQQTIQTFGAADIKIRYLGKAAGAGYGSAKAIKRKLLLFIVLGILLLPFLLLQFVDLSGNLYTNALFFLSVILCLSELVFLMYSYYTINKLEKELTGTANIRSGIEKLVSSIERNFNRVYWAGAIIGTASLGRDLLIVSWQPLYFTIAFIVYWALFSALKKASYRFLFANYLRRLRWIVNLYDLPY